MLTWCIPPAPQISPTSPKKKIKSKGNYQTKHTIKVGILSQPVFVFFLLTFVYSCLLLFFHLFNLLDILKSIVVIVEEEQGFQAAKLHLVHLRQTNVNEDVSGQK